MTSFFFGVDLRGLLAFFGVLSLLSAVSQRGHHGDGYQQAMSLTYLSSFILQVLQHIGSLGEPSVMPGNHSDLAS